MNGVKVERNVPIQEAAKEMGKSMQFVRIGLQRGLLTFGTAQMIPREQEIYILYKSKEIFCLHRQRTTSKV